MEISLIICSYNRADSLKETLLSLDNQSYSKNNWELIVVDNNSTDHTKEVIDTFATTLPNLIYRFEERQGLSFARNTGINLARGDIIVFTDDDVLPANNWLAEIKINMDMYHCDACGGYISPLWEKAPPAWLTEIFYGYLAIKTDSAGPRQLTSSAELPFGANMAFRKEVFSKFSVFDTNKGRVGNVLSSGEDSDMFQSILDGEGMIYYFPHIKVQHKVEAFRTRKNYFRRWRYQSSKNIAATTDYQGARRLFNIPVYMIKQTINAIALACKSYLTDPADISFRKEMIVWHFFGLIAGIISCNSAKK